MPCHLLKYINAPPAESKGCKDLWIGNFINEGTIPEEPSRIELLRIWENLFIMEHGTGGDMHFRSDLFKKPSEDSLYVGHHYTIFRDIIPFIYILVSGHMWYS